MTKTIKLAREQSLELVSKANEKNNICEAYRQKCLSIMLYIELYKDGEMKNKTLIKLIEEILSMY